MTAMGQVCSIEWQHILLGVLGLIIRWLIHMERAFTKKKDLFELRVYLRKNVIMIILTVFCTAALLLLTPMCLDIFGYPEIWGNVFAFTGGLLNRELVVRLKDKVIDKLNTKETNTRTPRKKAQ